MGGVTIPGAEFDSSKEAMDFLNNRREYYEQSCHLQFVGYSIESKDGKLILYARWTK